MKTKLFLLVGCLLAAVTLNAQSIKAVEVESVEVSAENSSANAVYASFWCSDEGTAALVSIRLSEPISCTVSVKGYIKTYLNHGGPGEEVQFSFRLNPGETYAYGRFFKHWQNSFAEGEGMYSDGATPSRCDGKTIIYNLNRE